MVGKALLVWFMLSGLAVANGLLRERVLRTRLSEPVAHVVSTIVLSGLILVTAFATQDFIGPSSLGQSWAVGAIWLAATLTFEFIAGHYLFRNPWSKIIADYNVRRGRVWILIPACTLFAPALSFRGLDEKWVLPYAISLAIACSLLVASVTRPILTKRAIALIFGWAACTNTWIGLNTPLDYQGFADLALIPWYSDFIRGPFRQYDAAMIVAIAGGQMITSVGLLLPGRANFIGGLGVCTFLLAIAPFGMGSAFPFSVLVSLAAVIATSNVVPQSTPLP